MNQADANARSQTVFDTDLLELVVSTPALSAKNVLERDSLMYVSLMVMMGKVFSVRFCTGEVETARNEGEFADLILKRMKES